MNHEHQYVLELIPAYVLGCLDEADLQYVESHLASCPTCRAEVEIYRSVRDSLTLTTAPVAPPPELRAQLMERVAATPDAPAEMDPATFWGRLTAFSQRVAPIWTPLSLLLIVGLLLLTGLLWQNRAVDPVEPTTIVMTSTDRAPGAAGLLVTSDQSSRGTLLVNGLPPLSPSEQYQLWLILDGVRTDGGVFSVDESGAGRLEIDAPQPLLEYAAYGITIEPTGGSPGPTGDRVLGAGL